MDNLDRLVTEIRKIAAERPDTVYESSLCHYNFGLCNDGSTGCLIGQALNAIDWPLYGEFSGHRISALLKDMVSNSFRL